MSSREESGSRRPGSAPRAVALSVAAAMAAPVAWAFKRIFEQPARTMPMSAPRRVIETAFGKVATFEDGPAAGVPLILLHGMEASSSSTETRPLFDAFRSERPVIAVDLLGHGGSIGPESRPTREEHVQSIEAVLVDVTGRLGGTVDLVALRATAELAAVAARRNPALVRSLTLVQASGLERGPARLLRRLREGDVGQPLAERYDVVGVPTLFVNGARTIIQHGALRRLIEKHATWSSVLIEGAGSAPLTERGAETARAIRVFQRAIPTRPRLRLIRGERRDGASPTPRRPSTSLLRAARGGRD